MIPRVLILSGLCLTLGVAAMAQQPSKPKPAVEKKPGGAKAIGRYDDWVAASHPEAGQPTCYAFTRAQSSTPALPGRGSAVLTVTQRASGRDAVALDAGFAYPADAAVTMTADSASVAFYTHQHAAFARDGHAAVAAFQIAAHAVAHSPGPHDTKVTDTFSLKGFSAAYAAISKECPAK